MGSRGQRNWHLPSRAILVVLVAGSLQLAAARPEAAGQSFPGDRFTPPAARGQAGAAGPPELPPPAAQTESTATPKQPSGDRAAAAEPQPQPIEGGQIIARVGSEVILAADLAPTVNQILAQNAKQIPAGDLDRVRRLLMKQQLASQIDIKLIYSDARRVIPEENFPKIGESLGERFDEVQLPRLIESAKVSNRVALDAQLHQLGTSLAQHRRTFIERTLAQQWLQQQLETDEEITHEQLLTYYQAHRQEYALEAKVRWEELVARFDGFRSKVEAWAAIATWGNEVLSGRPFLEVARQHSQGVTAQTGGQYDWTRKGSLISDAVDTALFTLPVGQLSQIVEDDTSFRIVRVIERTEAGATPFIEAQPDIRKKIQVERRGQAVQKYLTELREKTLVWTVFDDDPPAAETSPEVARRPS